MRQVVPRLVAGVLLITSVVGVGCSDDGTVDTDKAKDQANQASQSIKKETRDAWATMRTDGNRLVDQVQTRNDPEAQRQLLENCRKSVEQMRKNDAPNSDQVNRLCDRIRDTDVKNSNAWNEIKTQFNDLNTRFGGS